MADSSDTPLPSKFSGMPADPDEPKGPVYTVESRSGGENDVTAAGKYLLMAVPQFAKDPITGNLMTSYLRLGASSTTWQQDPGGWLAAKIHLHGPPGDHLSPDAPHGAIAPDTQVITPAEERSEDRVFIDDNRNRVTDVQHKLSKGQRAEQSRIIHTRGGWRDHSDGNRISTTYGDKIEVIRGNYKMVVLGRQDTDDASSGWDASGQHIQDWGYTMPGASVRVEESTNYTTQDGHNVWHLQNTTEGVVQSSNFAGDFFTYTWGKKKFDFVGQEVPAEKGPNGYPRQNPHIKSVTWAERIESRTGSPANRIPLIDSLLWAKDVTEETHIDTSTTNEEIGTTTTTSNIGTSRTTSTIDTQEETSTVTTSTTTSTVTTSTTTETIAVETTTSTVGVSSALSTTGAELDISIKGAALGINVVGAQADLTAAGAHAEIDLKLVHATAEICPFRFDFFLGMMMNIQLGAFLEIKAGWKKEIGSLKDTTEATITNTAAVYSVSAALIMLG
ncbi:MAG: hypothetical protein U0271_45605 [Polyangiaceae bacterium]